MEPFPHQDASSRRAWSRLWVALATLLLFAGPSSAGIRGPGKYSGVVVFDRWDGCLLFSSVYLMYISEVVKDDPAVMRVRQYRLMHSMYSNASIQAMD